MLFAERMKFYVGKNSVSIPRSLLERVLWETKLRKLESRGPLHRSTPSGPLGRAKQAYHPRHAGQTRRNHNDPPAVFDPTFRVVLLVSYRTPLALRFQSRNSTE